jgi:hypothetical protein
LCVLRNKSRLRLELCFLISCNCYGYWFNTFLITKHSLGPIGDSPLLDQTSSKRTKEIAVYVGALISIPLIFIMIKIQIIQIILCTPSVHWLSYISFTKLLKEEDHGRN